MLLFIRGLEKRPTRALRLLQRRLLRVSGKRCMDSRLSNRNTATSCGEACGCTRFSERRARRGATHGNGHPWHTSSFSCKNQNQKPKTHSLFSVVSTLDKLVVSRFCFSFFELAWNRVSWRGRGNDQRRGKLSPAGWTRVRIFSEACPNSITGAFFPGFRTLCERR